MSKHGHRHDIRTGPQEETEPGHGERVRPARGGQTQVLEKEVDRSELPGQIEERAEQQPIQEAQVRPNWGQQSRLAGSLSAMGDPNVWGPGQDEDDHAAEVREDPADSAWGGVQQLGQLQISLLGQGEGFPFGEACWVRSQTG